MKFNLKNFLILLLPIVAIGSLSAFYRYKYFLNPDGLKDSKGKYYEMDISWFIDTEAFVNKCLTFEQNDSKIYYGENKYFDYLEKKGFDTREQKITLRGYGKLLNSCKSGVLIKGLSMQNKIGDGEYSLGLGNDAYYPNINNEDLEDFDARNNLLFPEGNYLKGNSSIKIELESTEWLKSNPYGGFDRGIPNKNDSVSFKLNKEYALFHFSIDNDDKGPLIPGLEGLANFRILVKNPRETSRISLGPDDCSLYKKGKYIEKGCELDEWQLGGTEVNNVVKNSVDFVKFTRSFWEKESKN